jgi:hypothetical protein
VVNLGQELFGTKRGCRLRKFEIWQNAEGYFELRRLDGTVIARKGSMQELGHEIARIAVTSDANEGRVRG